ncbi:hypothetical protein LOAG_03559 [Loa loa]|uniref:Uncharacterized protein n=1 Tax=Loa loa TaxID=7209 RepID=A0A1S0U4E1_LOALO|nr:hypothetical protein LOAG_03559 [Loa loa]EFO24924.1 hypothetical protein LOAG_03559 [Loa loa]
MGYCLEHCKHWNLWWLEDFNQKEGKFWNERHKKNTIQQNRRNIQLFFQILLVTANYEKQDSNLPLVESDQLAQTLVLLIDTITNFPFWQDWTNGTGLDNFCLIRKCNDYEFKAIENCGKLKPISL